MLFTNKINITVLITSVHQRNITINTANYYSNICDEVIVVDEEQPHLSYVDISKLKKKGITYIGFNTSKNELSIKSIYQKRLIAAKKSTNKYVVHSNHDERYTYHGLLACISELENNKNLIFCAGQAVAVRKVKQKIYYTRSYEKLYNYQNIDKVDQRLLNHARNYIPIAHYSVWCKEFYINATQKTIFLNDLIPASGLCDEVIFEFISDIAGKSKAIPELYWIRNRVNPPGPKHRRDQGDHSFKIAKDKLNILLKDHNNIHTDEIMMYLHKAFHTVRSKSLLDKIFLLIKLLIYSLIKKEKIDDVDVLLNKNEIIYNKTDFFKALNSMNL
ncbi:hypothetical protein N8896_00995 [Candidatus Pelagibacter ubique]|nr:hypothetical protein [Candidatus Pelagibacter ubique]